MSEPVREVLTWELFGTAARELAQTVVDSGEGGSLVGATVQGRVLIVDDVADTGETLRMVRDFCEAHVAETRTAVLYEKSQSVVKCDYVWKRTDQWIAFPWSSEPPLVGRHTEN